jgi:hypothetical protein
MPQDDLRAKLVQHLHSKAPLHTVLYAKDSAMNEVIDA